MRAIAALVLVTAICLVAPAVVGAPVGIYVDIVSAAAVLVGTALFLGVTFAPRDLLAWVGVSFGRCPKGEETLRTALRVSEAGRCAAVALGALGTFVGYVIILANLQSIASLGRGTAVALIPTLYGVGVGELFFGALCTAAARRLPAGATRRSQGNLPMMIIFAFLGVVLSLLVLLAATLP